MALRLRRDVQKASYYVWFLGAEEAKGLRGTRIINSVLPYLVERSRDQEALKLTLQVSHKGIKIVQGSSKHLIPHSAITSSVQTDDIVACVLLLYNPATKCPLHVHAYRCDSESTAEALHLQLQILIGRPDNQMRFEELESRLPENFNSLRHIDMFSVENCLKAHKSSISELLELFNVKSDDIEKTLPQYGNIHLVKWECIDNTLLLWTEVAKYKDSGGNKTFSQLATFALNLLSLPWSNAEVERVFSQVSIIKTKLRNSLQTETLNAILSIRLGIQHPLHASGHGHHSSKKIHSDKRQDSAHKSKHNQTSGFLNQKQHLRSHDTSPKHLSSSLGSDTGNSTRESECSEEHGATASSGSRSPTYRNNNSHKRGKNYPLHHPQGLPPLTEQQNSDLFDSLAAELRAKLNGDGAPLLLPPRDYDTVHRSKGNLTAIELRRCRNTQIVGSGVTPKVADAKYTTTAVEKASAVTITTGKQVSSRVSSGIGSDLAPSPERREINSSSDDEHWSNETDNAVIALKPSQIAYPFHALRISAMQPQEDSYLRDLPEKSYDPRQSGRDQISEFKRKDEHERKKTETPSKFWSRMEKTKQSMLRPADCGAKFNCVMELEKQKEPQEGATKLHISDKYNEIICLQKTKLPDSDSAKNGEREQERELIKKRSVLVKKFVDSFVDSPKFNAAVEGQRYGVNGHHFVNPDEQPISLGQTKSTAVYRYADQSTRLSSSCSNNNVSSNNSSKCSLSEGHERQGVERQRIHNHSRDHNPYLEAESKPYIQSIEKMMTSTSMHKNDNQALKPSSSCVNSAAETAINSADLSCNVPPRDRFHDSKYKFRAMKQSSCSNRYDLKERDGAAVGKTLYDCRASSRRRHGCAQPSSYRKWSLEEEEVALERDRDRRDRDSLMKQEEDRNFKRERELDRQAIRDSHQSQAQQHLRHQQCPQVHDYLQSADTVKSSSSSVSHRELRYSSPGRASGSKVHSSTEFGSGKQLCSLPNGQRHSYVEPMFARSGGRVGLAAVNPY